jgi:hypothetical protein
LCFYLINEGTGRKNTFKSVSVYFVLHISAYLPWCQKLFQNLRIQINLWKSHRFKWKKYSKCFIESDSRFRLLPQHLISKSLPTPLEQNPPWADSTNCFSLVTNTRLSEDIKDFFDIITLPMNMREHTKNYHCNFV